MNVKRQKLENIKSAIKESFKETLDFAQTKDVFLHWLSQFDFPAYPNAENWEECLESFPDPSVDCKIPKDGLKLRFLLKLFTTNHRYVISIIECFDADAHGIGILSVHVNMDEIEYKQQKTLELTYKNSFDSSLKPRQTLFVEPFKSETFLDSLQNAGFSILGNELVGKMSTKTLPIIKNIVPQQVTFPETED